MSPILFKNKFNASVSTETFLIYRNGLCHSKFTHYEYKQLYTHVAKLKDGSNQNRNFIRGLGGCPSTGLIHVQLRATLY